METGLGSTKKDKEIIFEHTKGEKITTLEQATEIMYALLEQRPGRMTPEEHARQEEIFRKEEAKQKYSLFNRNVEKINILAMAAAKEGKTIAGVLDEDGTIVKIIEIEDEARLAQKEDLLNKEQEKRFRKKILELCYMGIKEADYFINSYPKHILGKPEQVKEDLYRITYLFDDLLNQK